MQGFSPKDLLSFERMLSISLVKVLYFLVLIGIVLVGIVSFFGSVAAMRFSATTGLGGMLVAVLGMGAGVLVWRVVCELWIVIFGIYDRLGQLRERGASDVHATR